MWSKLKHIKIEKENQDLIYFQYDYLSSQYLTINLAWKRIKNRQELKKQLNVNSQRKKVFRYPF